MNDERRMRWTGCRAFAVESSERLDRTQGTLEQIEAAIRWELRGRAA